MTLAERGLIQHVTLARDGLVFETDYEYRNERDNDYGRPHKVTDSNNSVGREITREYDYCVGNAVGPSAHWLLRTISRSSLEKPRQKRSASGERTPCDRGSTTMPPAS
jgi:hypothetical protein